MSTAKTAFIFPAFVRDYQLQASEDPDSWNAVFTDLIQTASRMADPELQFFHPTHQPFLDHELRTQFIAYVYGCTYARILRERGIHPDYLSGYSMGIYAALAEGGSIAFEEGLHLIKSAFQEISYTTLSGRFGMGGIIGLSKEDISHFLLPYPDTRICNQNSPFSFILSGRQQDLEQVLELARQEGAFHARMLNVTVPYHSHLLKAAALQFARFVHSMDIHPPAVPVISVLSQKKLTAPEEIKTELADNLYQPFNWYKTQLAMQDLGVNQFIECGPGNSLKKNARFIPGNYRFLSIQEINQP